MQLLTCLKGSTSNSCQGSLGAGLQPPPELPTYNLKLARYMEGRGRLEEKGGPLQMGQGQV